MPGQCNTLFLHLVSIVEREITKISVDEKNKIKTDSAVRGRLNICEKQMCKPLVFLCICPMIFFPCIWGKMLKLDALSGPYFKSLARFAAVVACRALPNTSLSFGVSFMPELLLVNIHPSNTRAGLSLGKGLVNPLRKEELQTVTGGSSCKSVYKSI